jgi:hypothetical protein
MKGDDSDERLFGVGVGNLQRVYAEVRRRTGDFFRRGPDEFRLGKVCRIDSN